MQANDNNSALDLMMQQLEILERIEKTLDRIERNQSLQNTQTWPRRNEQWPYDGEFTFSSSQPDQSYERSSLTKYGSDKLKFSNNPLMPAGYKRDNMRGDY